MNPLRLYRKYKHSPRTTHAPISYYNFWDGQSADEIWFTNFLLDRGVTRDYPKAKFAFFSTLGNINLLKIDDLLHPFSKNRKRIFFTGENVHYEVFKSYVHNMLDFPAIDLSLGFDLIDDERYVRFPLWILEMFPPNSTVTDIKQICERLSHQKPGNERVRFCAMVSGNNTTLGDEHIQLRTTMVNALRTVADVDCAGRLLRNTEELQTLFHDDKAEFLKQYKFFICPENTSVDGYVTEKVFHSIGSGCIPIYRGSLNNPEPDVLNHDAILFWEKDEDNASLVRKVDELWNNPALYREFFEQPRLQPNAWEVVAHYFDTLEKKLHEICQQR